MIKVFIDSDIILDLLTRRNDYDSAASLLSRIERGDFSGYTSGVVLANVHYIMSKYAGRKKSLENLRLLRKLLSIIAIDEEIIDEALGSDPVDFEDAVQYCAAAKKKLNFIITRNKKDYKQSLVPVMTAGEFLEAGAGGV